MNSPPESSLPQSARQNWRVQAINYALAALVVGAATTIKLLLLPPGAGSPALLYFGAIMLCAWRGGLGAGLFASLLCALAAHYFFSAARGDSMSSPTGVLQVAILFAEGALISLLAAAKNRAEGKAQTQTIQARDHAGRAAKAELQVLDREKLGRAILDSLEAHIAVLDQAGNIIAVNEAWEKFGRDNKSSGNELPESAATDRIGANYLDACRRSDDADARRALAGIETVLKGAQTRFSMEYPCHAPRDKRWFLLLVTPLSTIETSGRGAVVSHFDISERRHAEIERARLFERERELREEAQAASRAKDEFLTAVSHELRTPLNSILGWTQLLTSGQLDEPISRQGLEVIERSVLTQAQLVNDLLDVSRIVTGKINLHLTRVSLQTSAQKALDEARPFAGEKNIRLEAEFEADACIEGDAERLQHILRNLLHNAIKFSPPNSRVLLRLERIGKDAISSRARISIVDEGIGITPEFLPHLFDRFRQADAGATREFGGLGLGLSIARHLVELHGGSIAAFSEGENKGATFVVEFPILTSGVLQT